MCCILRGDRIELDRDAFLAIGIDNATAMLSLMQEVTLCIKIADTNEARFMK